jgi:hypothetical protein
LYSNLPLSLIIEKERGRMGTRYLLWMEGVRGYWGLTSGFAEEDWEDGWKLLFLDGLWDRKFGNLR